MDAGNHAYKKKGGNPIKADLRYLPFNLFNIGTIFAFHCLEHISKKDCFSLLTELSQHKRVFIEVPEFPLLYVASKEVGHDLSQNSFKSADFEQFGFRRCYTFSPQSVLLMTNRVVQTC